MFIIGDIVQSTNPERKHIIVDVDDSDLHCTHYGTVPATKANIAQFKKLESSNTFPYARAWHWSFELKFVQAI